MIPTPRSAFRTAALSVACCALAAPTCAAGQTVAEGPELPVVEHSLANGMRFLLLPRPGAPIVSFAMDVAVGSVDDPPGRTGVSHLLEHLLFKGTSTVGARDLPAELELFGTMDAANDSAVAASDPVARERLLARILALEDSARTVAASDEFNAIYARNGARGLNATTGYHETRFVVSLPANRIELWFALESDRFSDPVFRDFFTERRVVLEERRSRLESVPGATLRAAALRAAFPDGGYGVPPLGYREDLETLGRSDVDAFYREHFRPDRMTAAIVGDFDPDQAVAWAERYFGRLENPVSEPPRPGETGSAEQDGERRIEVAFDARPQVQIAWRIPPASDPDTPALLVLTNLLVGSSDARLNRGLVADGGPASSVVADLGPAAGGTRLFTIQAAPREGRAPEDVEAAVYAEIDRLLLSPPTDEELDRIRTRLEVAEARSMVSAEGLASELLATVALRGDWREIFAVQAGMRAVDADDVARVVDRYLRAERRTVAILRATETGVGP